MDTIQYERVIERKENIMIHEFTQVFNLLNWSKAQREKYEARHIRTGESPNYSLSQTFLKGVKAEEYEDELSKSDSPLTKKLREQFAGFGGNLTVENGDTLDQTADNIVPQQLENERTEKEEFEKRKKEKVSDKHTGNKKNKEQEKQETTKENDNEQSGDGE